MKIRIKYKNKEEEKDFKFKHRNPLYQFVKKKHHVIRNKQNDIQRKAKYKEKYIIGEEYEN